MPTFDSARSGAFDAVPAGLGDVLSAREYTSLTPIQESVLAPQLEGRDLRIASRTGSGKTVAVGLALARELGPALGPRRSASGQAARPVVLVLAPTRELARQVAEELTWLFAPFRGGVAAVTGGTAYGLDRRALGSQPAVLVGTPGRLLDHLQQGRLDLSECRAVVLDEADEMLDMGFRDDLEAILAAAPESRRTHLVSATFPPGVRALAERFQRDAVPVEGSAPGVAHADITHQMVVVPQARRLDAIRNFLLAAPDTLTLVFVRTRADAAEVGERLSTMGFAAAPLHGDLSQSERNSTLQAFRDGRVRVLVATDVAARGLDVPGIGQVIHAELPDGPDAFTHRSGRTGRAGRKGVSILLVPHGAIRRAERLLAMSRIRAEKVAVPSAADIREAADRRLIEAIAAAPAAEDAPDGLGALAARLLEARPAVDVVAALLAESGHRGPIAPAELPVEAPRPPRPRIAPGPRGEAGYTLFHVSYGTRHGADPRRVLAMVCRRGDVDKASIGRIQVGEASSVVEVLEATADHFRQAAAQPDPRDPKVRIRPFDPKHAGADTDARPGGAPPRRRKGGPGGPAPRGRKGGPGSRHH